MVGTALFWLALSSIALASCADIDSTSGGRPTAGMKLEPNDKPSPPQSRRRSGCDVTIGFGSFATGIDHKAAATVERLVMADRSVTRVTRSPHGREGEYSLCVRTASREHSIKLFETLEKSLREPVDAPVFVNGPGRSFSAPPARRP